jgi:hypothetical protein
MKSINNLLIEYLGESFIQNIDINIKKALYDSLFSFGERCFNIGVSKQYLYGDSYSQYLYDLEYSGTGKTRMDCLNDVFISPLSLNIFNSSQIDKILISMFNFGEQCFYSGMNESCDYNDSFIIYNQHLDNN